MACREERVPCVPTPVGSHLPSSSSGLARGSDADLPLRVAVTPGATLPRDGGLGSLRRGQKCCHQPAPTRLENPLKPNPALVSAEGGDRLRLAVFPRCPPHPPGPPCHLPRGCSALGGRWSAGHRLPPGRGDTGSGFSLGIAAGAAQALLQPQPQPPHLVLQRTDGLAAPGQMAQ